VSKWNPNTLRVHVLLARSYPEPLTCRQIAAGLDVGVRVAQRAIDRAKASGAIRPTRSMNQGRVFAYTVNV
jgi:DNA-binding transcriptional regulator LsrR (DeoR family)